MVWELKEGVDALNYEMSPDDVKWFAELGKLTGGMDKANEKMNEFFSYVKSWKTELALKK